MKKRLLSYILALALCIGMCPVGAWAVEGKPTSLPNTVTTVDSVKFAESYLNGLSHSYNAVATPVPTKADVLLVVGDQEYTIPDGMKYTIQTKWYRVANNPNGGAPIKTEISYQPSDVGTYSASIVVSLGEATDDTPASPALTDNTADTPTFTISKKNVELKLRNDIKKPYDGLASYTVTTDTPTPFQYDESNIEEADYSSVIIQGNFRFDDSKVGVNKTFTASDFSLTGEKAGNYEISNTPRTLSVNNAEITKLFLTQTSTDSMLVRNKQERTYTYALKGLLPTLPSNLMEYEDVVYKLDNVSVDRPAFFEHVDPLEGGDIAITGEKKDQLTVKIKEANHSGENPVATVHFTVSSKNFQDFEGILTITSDDRTPVKILNLEVVDRPQYDGTEVVGYTGLAEFKQTLTDGTLVDLPEGETINRATLVKTYEATGRSQSGTYGPTETPPTEPGEYTVTVSIPESNLNYAGSWKGTFTITRAKVTVKAIDRTIKVDDPVPEFKNPVLGVDYEVIGLSKVANHELRQPPTLKYATVADSILPGEFEILIDGAMVPDTTHYDPAIQFVPGKLTEKSHLDITGGNPFSDVSEYTWYVTAVEYVYNKGLMKGVTSTLFDPTGDLTRGMLVTILYRLDGEWPVWNTMPFTDLDPNAYYMSAVRWASQARIINGYGDGRFGPNDVLTREQLAIILYNYSRYCGKSPNKAASLDAFVDAYNTTSAGYRALQWACAEGLIQGTGSTTLSPGEKALRAQVAVIFMRYCTNVLGY